MTPEEEFAQRDPVESADPRARDVIPEPTPDLSDAEFRDKYADKIEAMGQLGDRYDGSEMEYKDTRDEVESATEGALSDVPSEDRGRLVNMAREEFPAYEDLEWERDFWTRSEDRKFQREL